MEDLNHLFSGFSNLFDKSTSPEQRSRIEASIKARVEANLNLIMEAAASGNTTKNTTTINL